MNIPKLLRSIFKRGSQSKEEFNLFSACYFPKNKSFLPKRKPDEIVIERKEHSEKN